MRILRLARIAAEAEALRLSRVARATVGRSLRVLLALPFLAVSAGFLEVALYAYLDTRLRDWAVALAMAGVNLLLALLLALPALRGRADPVARQAEQIRRQAVDGIEERLRLGVALTELIQALAQVLRRLGRAP